VARNCIHMTNCDKTNNTFIAITFHKLKQNRNRDNNAVHSPNSSLIMKQANCKTSTSNRLIWVVQKCNTNHDDMSYAKLQRHICTYSYNHAGKPVMIQFLAKERHAFCIWYSHELRDEWNVQSSDTKNRTFCLNFNPSKSIQSFNNFLINYLLISSALISISVTI